MTVTAITSRGGTNADYVAALIGEVPFFLEANANMPRTSGRNQVHISLDLMGQCASETIAGRPWSSSGGQADFARGAMWSPGGQGFIVLKSTTSSGRCRIRTQLIPGSAVTTMARQCKRLAAQAVFRP
jgi:hypothetical protein